MPSGRGVMCPRGGGVMCPWGGGSCAGVISILSSCYSISNCDHFYKLTVHFTVCPYCPIIRIIQSEFAIIIPSCLLARARATITMTTRDAITCQSLAQEPHKRHSESLEWRSSTWRRSCNAGALSPQVFGPM